MNTPLISIITPTYNREKFIVEAIVSVLAQTYENWELIIIDDGSEDLTKKVIEPFLKDSRIKYFYQHNQGQSKARNKGILEATGEYISFLDSDNRWLSNKLEVSYLAMCATSNDADIIYADGITINENGDEISREVMPRHSGFITPQLIRDNFVSMNTTLVKTECFRKHGMFDENDRLAEDYELWLRFSLHYKFAHISEYVSEYRVMENQLSSDKLSRFKANEHILHKFINNYRTELEDINVNRSLASFYVRKARYFSTIKNYKQAFKDNFYAIKLAPFWVGTWRALFKVALKFLKFK